MSDKTEGLNPELTAEFEKIQLISLQSARKMKEAVGVAEALGRKANSA